MAARGVCGRARLGHRAWGGLGEVGGLGVGLRWRGWEGGLVGRAGRGI